MKNPSPIFLGLIIITLLTFLFSIEDSLAKTDLSITVSDITFSEIEPLEGDTVRVFARVFNLGDADVYGFVIFLNNGKEMVDLQPISVKVNTYDDVFIDWIVESGTYDIQAKIIGTNPADDNPVNDAAMQEDYFVDLDTDGDKIGNTKDLDDDNDDLSDEKEAILGTDPLSPDTDGDGVGDKGDVFPLDPAETKDNDGDGLGNNADTDDDNDGLTDEEEKIIGTDSFNRDTDGDRVQDNSDVFPLDSTEWQDSDNDGLGDNTDTDDDNDGLTDEEELFVFGTNPLSSDSDNDGLSDKEEIDLGTNSLEEDSDGDGLIDSEDDFPLNPAKAQASMVEAARTAIEDRGLSPIQILAGSGLVLILALILFLSLKRKRRSRF